MMQITYYSLDEGLGLMKMEEDTKSVNLYYMSTEGEWVKDNSLIHEFSDANADEITKEQAMRLALKKHGKL